MAPRAGLSPDRGTSFTPTPFRRTKCASPAISAPIAPTFNRNGCFFNNFWNSSKGGTPLTIDVTQTGGSGSPVYVYWVNATNLDISITGNAQAKYYCP